MCLFSFFSHDKYSTNDKSIDGVLGTQTRGGRMVGADESVELWRHPLSLCLLVKPLRDVFLILTYLVKGSITVRLTSCFTVQLATPDLIDSFGFNCFTAHAEETSFLFGRIQSSQTGFQLNSDPSLLQSK